MITLTQQKITYAWFNSILSIVSMLLIILFHSEKNFLDKLYFDSLAKIKLLNSCLISIVLLCLFHLVYNYCCSLFGYLPLQFQFLQLLPIINLGVNILFYSIIEETIFRGYIQGEIYQMTNKLPFSLNTFYTIFVPALLFSLMHFFKMGPSCFIIVIPGILFGALKLYSGTIYSAIFAHFIFNFYYFNLLEPKPF